MSEDKALIYQIRCEATQELYVGSTTMTLHERLRYHLGHLRAYKAGNFGKIAVFPILERGSYKIELLEEVPADQRRQKEQEWIDRVDCVNYYAAYVDDQVERNKLYRERGKDRIKVSHKMWRQNNRERVREWDNRYKASHRAELNEKQKAYYQVNREVILEKMRTPVQCECGAMISRTNLLRHQRESKTHRIRLAAIASDSQLLASHRPEAGSAVAGSGA